ncbi:hypothetical protein ACFW04_013406 [Cataglyphis niger]
MKCDIMPLSDKTRPNLDETMITVTEILETSPRAGKYEHLEERLIKSFTDSQKKQLRTLLLSIELGDKKSS